MKAALVVLGNGYDLYHEQKTSYKDFIDYEIGKGNTSNLWIKCFNKKIELEGWIDIENEFKEVLENYVELKESYPYLNLRQKIKIRYLPILNFLNFDLVYSSNEDGTKRVDYNYLIIKKRDGRFVRDRDGLDYGNVNKVLIDDFKKVKESLKEYIKNNVKPNDKYTKKNSIYKTLNEYDHLVVLNFNYTNTLQHYNKNITNIFIHGDVDTEIILGHNEIKYNKFPMFDKRVQELTYKQGFKNQISKINYSNYTDLDFVILGHSMDSNDHDVIRWSYIKILEQTKGKYDRMKVFYYGESDLISRMYNIKSFFNITGIHGDFERFQEGGTLEKIKL